MKDGWYWVKENEDHDWFPTWYTGKNFIWFNVCHGQEDLVLHPSEVYKFNPKALTEPEDA